MKFNISFELDNVLSLSDMDAALDEIQQVLNTWNAKNCHIDDRPDPREPLRLTRRQNLSEAVGHFVSSVTRSTKGES